MILCVGVGALAMTLFVSFQNGRRWIEKYRARTIVAKEREADMNRAMEIKSGRPIQDQMITIRSFELME
eukprot:scaffold25905_cov64-Attheya_sp.AAC.2